jgi:hypothetical protein
MGILILGCTEAYWESRSMVVPASTIGSTQDIVAMETAHKVYKSITAVNDANESLSPLLKTYKSILEAARALKCEAVLSYAITVRVRDNARKIIRKELVPLTGGLFPEDLIHPLLLKKSHEILG